MLERLDYITSFNTEDVDTEYMLQSDNKQFVDSNYNTENLTGNKKSFLKMKYEDFNEHDDYSESKSFVDVGKIFFS